MACLFIGTLKRVTFEWFMKLPEGSIHCWSELKKLFEAQFFEDDSGIAMTTLLATKQQRESLSRSSSKDSGKLCSYDQAA